MLNVNKALGGSSVRLNVCFCVSRATRYGEREEHPRTDRPHGVVYSRIRKLGGDTT